MNDPMLEHLRMPPHSIEAEQSVLGGVMLAQAMGKVADIVTANDFYKSEHRAIFEAITRLHNRNEVTDAVTVGEEMDEHELNMPYLIELANNTPSAANIVAYAKIVVDRAIARRIIQAANSLAEYGYDKNMPLEDKIESAEQLLLTFRQTGTTEVGTAREAVKAAYEEIEYRNNHRGQIVGMEFGFNAVDSRFWGVRGGDLVIVAGRPSMGKSTFLQNIAEFNAIKQSKPVLIFSMEMSKEDIVSRMFSSEGDIPFGDIRSGKAADNDKLVDAMMAVGDAPLFIDDTPAISINKLKAKARRIHVENGGLGLIGVDYLQLMSGDADSREQEIATISRGLKELAMELRVPVIALSQLNRGLESRKDKEPMMSDLRESGAIEQDADIIIFLYRDEVYYPFHSVEKGKARVITRKFRNGAIGTDYLDVDFAHMRFRDEPRQLETDEDEQESPVETHSKGGKFEYK